MITPTKCGRPLGWGKLGPCKAFLVEVVAQGEEDQKIVQGTVFPTNDITSRELQGALAEAEGVRANETSLSRALRRLGFTYKKSHWSRTSSEGPTSPAPAGIG